MTGSRPRDGLPWVLRKGPRRSFRWTAYVLAVTSFAAAVPTPLYPRYEVAFQFSPGVLGLVFGAYTPGVLLTLLVLAPQADRIGRRTLLYVGMILTGAAAITFALSTGALDLALARFIAGLAVGCTTSVATAAMSDLEPDGDQHHVARVAVAANFGGFAAGVTLTGILATFATDPTQLVYLLPLIASGVGILAVRVLPETGPATVRGQRLGVQRVAVPAAVRLPFWVAVGGITACYSVYGFFAALIPSYVRNDLGLASPAVTGAIVGLLFGAVALTQLATSQIRDRQALMYGFPLLLGGLVALVLILPWQSWELLALVTLVLGAAVGLAFMGSVTLVDRVSPEQDRGEVLAGFYSAGYLALAIPTLGVAELSGQVGLVNAGILFGSILALAVATTFAAAYRTPTPPGGGGRPPDPRSSSRRG